ncbi:MAG: ATP-binding cassette domain-containing protein [Patescibacteria group bacterium]|jgi:ATPase subunit of ABC transporter with duplicated ATPase domains
MSNPFEGAAALYLAPESMEQPLARESELPPGYLKRHVVDIKPGRYGNKESLLGLGGAQFGCIDAEIDRCDPVVTVDEIKMVAGSSYVLIGPNGSGKSTVFDAIMGKDAEFTGHGNKHAVVYGESSQDRPRLRVARLDQEEILVGMHESSVAEVLEKAIETFSARQELDQVDWNQPDAQDKFDNLMADVQRSEESSSKLKKLFGINQFAGRKVSELSGGEKTKLSLSLVLMSQPDVLLLDEPTNHLDLESISMLHELLKMHVESDGSVLSVSHVDWFLDEAGVDGVMEIAYDGQQRSVGMSHAPYATYKKDANRQEFTIIDKNGKIDWSKQKKEISGAIISPVTEKVSVPDSPLQDIQVPSFLAKEVWVLSGGNGTGKTKLMEAMAGETPQSPFERSKAAIAYMPQFWPEDVAHGTVEEFFEWIHDQVNPHSMIMASNFFSALKEIGFKSVKSEADAEGKRFLNRPLASLSGGEQRLLWLVAVSRFENLSALFLDEPTNHMDPKLQEVVTRAIQDFPGAVMLSTHDPRLLAALNKNVGKKGSTMAPKNIVLEKKGDRTEVTVSKENPLAYMQKRMDEARKKARRLGRVA